MLSVKQARTMKGLTQLQVARATGLTQTTMSLIEKGKVFPRTSTQEKLKALLGTDIDFGLTWAQNTNN